MRLVFAAMIAIVLFAALNVKFGVLVGIIGAVSGFVLVTGVPILQSYLMAQQLKYARRQDEREVVREQRASAHAIIELQFWGEFPGANPLAAATPVRKSINDAQFRFEVFLHNDGTTENADDCHLEVLIPLIVMPMGFTGKDIKNFVMNPVEIDGVRYMRLSANCSTKVQPATTVPVGTITMVGTRESLLTPVKTEALWRVTNGPYVMPSRDRYGRITVGFMFP